MKILKLMALAGLLLASACTAPAIQPAAPAPLEDATAALTPYLTPTITPTHPAAAAAAEPTLAPPPSPTPRVHVVKRGEDMGGIAYAYGISLETLRAANPQVDPHAMPVGTELQIPAAENARPPETTSLPESSPAVGVRLDGEICYRTGDGGAWCFALARNDQEGALESVTAAFHVIPADGSEPLSQTAATLLDVIPAGGALPMAVSFPPPFPDGPFSVQTEVLTALPLENGADRYRPAQIEALVSRPSSSGLSADVSGEAWITPPPEGTEAAPAERVWVALTAFDAGGQVVGARRWEHTGPVQPGERLAFHLKIYSSGGAIARVEAAVEAR